MNNEEAAIWFRKAADQGNDDALYEWGILYADGSGVRKDEVLAAEFFKKAADKGHAQASEWLRYLSDQSDVST